MTKRNENVLDSARSAEYSKWLRTMILIRRFEEAAGEAYSVGHVGGFCHLYVGQEAVAVGSLAALQEDDVIIPLTNRDVLIEDPRQRHIELGQLVVMRGEQRQGFSRTPLV